MKYSPLSLSFLPIICSALWLSCQGPTAPSNEKTSELIELKVTEGTNMAVALSPDGNTLAFDLVGRIWLMPVSGGPAGPSPTHSVMRDNLLGLLTAESSHFKDIGKVTGTSTSSTLMAAT